MSLLKVNPAMLTGAPVKMTVEFTGSDGEDYSGDVYIKQHGLAETQALLKAYTGEEDDDALAKAIAAQCCDEKGKPLYQVDDVKRFNQSLILALLKAIGEVNNPKPKTMPLQ